jgi:hypothetical protein
MTVIMIQVPHLQITTAEMERESEHDRRARIHHSSIKQVVSLPFKVLHDCSTRGLYIRYSKMSKLIRQSEWL